MTKQLKKVEGEVRIIYKHNKPYGIRDDSGFLFFFTNISKYSNQEERYREEVEQQFRLADYLAECLNKKVEAEPKKVEITEEDLFNIISNTKLSYGCDVENCSTCTEENKDKCFVSKGVAEKLASSLKGKLEL